MRSTVLESCSCGQQCWSHVHAVNSVRNMVCGITNYTAGVMFPGVAVRSAGIVIYVAVRGVTLVVRGVMVSSVAVW